MTTNTETVLLGGSANFLASTNRFMPRVMFAPETGSGSGEGDEGNKDDDAKTGEGEGDKSGEKQDDKGADKSGDKQGDAGTGKDDPEKAELLREVMDKKNRLKDAEKKAADAAAALAAYEGIDPVKVRELMRKEADAEKAAAEAKGDFDRVKAMMVEEHNKEKGTLTGTIADLQAKLAEKDQVIDNLTVGNDFSGSTYIKDNLTLTPSKARKLYGAHFEVKDGKTVAFDKPAGSADRTMLVNSAGNPISFDDAMKRIIEADPDKDTLLKATVKAGGGSKHVAEKVQDKSNKPKVTGIDRLRGSIDDLLS